MLLIQLSFISSSFGELPSVPEKFYIHIDKPIYLTGETIWYKIYNSNFQASTDHSKIVYINLHDKNGRLLLQQKLKLDEGRSFGSLDIPISWKEDYYYLTCFTKWNLQFGAKGLAIKRIPIYNPFENQLAEKKDDLDANVEFQEEHLIDISKQENIILELNKESFTRREKASLSISTPERLVGNFSISIHSMNGFNFHEYSIFHNHTELLKSSAHYAIEVQDSKEKELTIEGQALDPVSGNPVISDVLSVYKVGSEKFYRTLSKEGIVRARIDNFNKKSTFQLFNMNPYQPSTPIFNLKLAGEKLMGLENEYSTPPRNERINNYLTNSRLSKKVYEIFEERTLDSLQGKHFIPIPFKADKVYQMEKYQSMKTLEEFLREIVIYVNIIKKDKSIIVRLKNTQTQHPFMEKPWYLVDGYLTRDEKLVLDIPFKNLSRVEIFNTNNSILGQLETVMIRSGMIAVYTDNYYLKDQLETSNNIFDFQGYSISRDFVGVEKISSSEARESPDFSSLLYWNPNVELKGKNTVEFVTSDLLGNFIIRVEGITDDGQRLSGSYVFSVRN